MDIEEILQLGSYSIGREEKKAILLEQLNVLSAHHYRRCMAYGSLLNAYGYGHEPVMELTDFFPLPVRLFKEYELKSCGTDEVIKTMTSSGTTSQKVSRIFLDRTTARHQSLALVRIVQNYLGGKRLPMLIIDTEKVLRDRSMFSARGAGILGFSTFGRNHTYALDENMELDFAILDEFLDRYGEGPLLVFGFTFMVWQYLYKPLLASGRKIDLAQGTLIHSGGWKKLVEEEVDNRTFRRLLRDTTGLGRVYNFYGMVEQVGSIFMECEHGYLHAPTFADILIRDYFTHRPLPMGEEGVIQVFSVLPHSYPGHSLLTEDVGMIVGEDDCPCGKKGKYFTVKGRIPAAEIRGCSDAHAYSGS